MGVRFYIERENASEEDPGIAKGCAPTQRYTLRLQAIEELYRGRSPGELAQLSDRVPTTIYRWVLLFNASGIDGIACKGKVGHPPKIGPERFAGEYVLLILNPEEVGESHEPALKFHGHLSQDCEEQLGCSTRLRYLKEHEVVHLFPEEISSIASINHLVKQHTHSVAPLRDAALFLCERSLSSLRGL